MIQNKKDLLYAIYSFAVERADLHMFFWMDPANGNLDNVTKDRIHAFGENTGGETRFLLSSTALGLGGGTLRVRIKPMKILTPSLERRRLGMPPGRRNRADPRRPQPRTEQEPGQEATPQERMLVVVVEDWMGEVGWHWSRGKGREQRRGQGQT